MRKTRLLSILALLLVAATGAWAQVGTPLTLEAKTAGTIQVIDPQNGMKYSKNGGAKTVMTTTQTINVVVGDKVQFYGDGINIPQYNGTFIEGGDAKCYIYGNIMSLVDENGFATATALSEPYTFNELFYGNGNLYNHPTNKLVLPATTLTAYCYSFMFAGCSSLTSAPELPATTLAVGCYGCMFKGCELLNSAPELPATTLAEYCYAYMFHDCNSLTSAPELPATTLADGCYAYMFKGCESLNSVTCLATNISAESSTKEWLDAVAATGTFTKAPGMNWGTGISGIPEGWTTKDYSPEPAATYTVALADNTEDAGNWQASVGNAEEFSVLPLQGVAEDDSVTLAYNGTREVMSVKVVKKAAPADEVTLATPLTLKALTAGTIKVNQPKSGMQYSLNGGTKTAVTTDAINVAAGDKVAFFGTGTNITSYNNTSIAGGTAEVKAYGNIMSLVDEENFATAITLTASNAFSSLFKDNGKLTDASDLLLPAETLAMSCYSSMFNSCTSLTAAPALPATTLAMSCYSSMFNSCTSLTAAPALPATTLAMSCYLSMFRNCTSLTAAPQLPASTLASSCYNSMFYGCTSLTAAPELPATTLAPNCYLKMFYSCTNLNTAPALPATTLAQNCYEEMFYSCQALTAAPELPATTLTYSCYRFMFGSCTSLTSAPVLPATTLTGYCYQSMFNGCSKLSSVTCRATNISADQCLNSWLSNAGTQASSPKLYVDPSMTNADWHNGNFFTVTAIP